MLTHQETLERLDLNRAWFCVCTLSHCTENRIGDSGAAALAHALAVNEALKYISLFSHGARLLGECRLLSQCTARTITKEGVSALAEAVDTNPSLPRLLYVAGTAIFLIESVEFTSLCNIVPL